MVLACLYNVGGILLCLSTGAHRGWFDFHDSVQMLVESVVSSISVRFKYNFRGASGEATGSDVTGSGPDHNRKSRK
jgi:hypothetical protein